MKTIITLNDNSPADFHAAAFALLIARELQAKLLICYTSKAKDLIKTVDVMINGMHNDLLVMINHRFHFEEIIGEYLGQAWPAHISVLLFIFPY